MDLNNQMFLILVFFMYKCKIKGFQVSNLDVPRYAMKGQNVTMRCHYDLGKETLYSMTWWKQDNLLFQFIPRNVPSSTFFLSKDVTVDRNHTDENKLRLLLIDDSAQGEYRCEVIGEAPRFPLSSKRSFMSILDPPDGPPVISGHKLFYRPDEIMALNCTTYSVWPLELSWLFSGDNEKIRMSMPRSHWGINNSSLRISRRSLNKFVNNDVPIHSEETISLKSFGTSALGIKNVNGLDLYIAHSHIHIAHSATNGTFKKVAEKHLVPYFAQTEMDHKGRTLFTTTLGLQIPAFLLKTENDTSKIWLKCEARLNIFKWATRIELKVQKAAIADPQQLPALHESEFNSNFKIIQSGGQTVLLPSKLNYVIFIFLMCGMMT